MSASSVDGDDLVHPPQRPRAPILVSVLNLLLFSGAGYIVMGQKTKGIVAIIVFLVLVTRTWGIGSMLIAVVSAIDGYLQAQQQHAGFALRQWSFFNDHA